MKLRRGLLCFIMLCRFSLTFGQSDPADSLKALLSVAIEDTNKVKLLLEISKAYINIEPDSAIPYSEQAKKLATQLNYDKGTALAYKYTGLACYLQSRHIEAMENYNHAQVVFGKISDLSGIANMQNNIGVIYKDQGIDAKALEFFFNSLKNAEAAGDILRITTALNNIGSVYQHKQATYEKALEYYMRALPLVRQLGDNDLFGAISGNIGEIYLQRNNTDSALFYFQEQLQAYEGTVTISYALNDLGHAYRQRNEFDKALLYHQQAYDSAYHANSVLYMMQSLKGKGDTYVRMGETGKAQRNYLQAERLAKEINSAYDLKDIYLGLANAYAENADFKNAYRYNSQLQDIKDTIYNKENDTKLASYEFNFEIEKKQGQIDLQQLDIRRQKLAKNAFIAGFAMILMLSFILYHNYRNKVKVNKLLDSQKAQIEHLLLNILPAEVAKELQQDGHATPRYYDKVSVLFTDFKGFTTIADSLSPQEVVAELNECFVAFDEIAEKQGLEKIKTIGDSYMCAGGVPVENDYHMISIVRAGMQIRDYMNNKNRQRQEAGLPPWELRIGIHTGPVVAGIVGKNKYAYDIWGSTVNIASRMESNGHPGEINISATVYNYIKDHFNCTYRGKISAKNIGEIDMYFVHDEKTDHHDQNGNSVMTQGKDARLNVS